MKFCLLVTVALDISIKEKNCPWIYPWISPMSFFLLGQAKRKGTLLTIFRSPPDIPTPPPTYYVLRKFPTPLLIRTPRLFGTLE